MTKWEVRDLIERLEKASNSYEIRHGDSLLFTEAARALEWIWDNPRPEESENNGR